MGSNDCQVSPDIQEFILGHPGLQLCPAGAKVRCRLTGHELPSRLSDLQAFTSGQKYQWLIRTIETFDHEDFEPRIVPSTKNPHKCSANSPFIISTDFQSTSCVQGQHYQKVLHKYEERQKQGVEYVPAFLQQKKWRQEVLRDGDQQSQTREDFWKPESSDEEDESEDSMSDLYQAELFTEKNPSENGDVTRSYLTDTEDNDTQFSRENGIVRRGEKMEVDGPACTKKTKK